MFSATVFHWDTSYKSDYFSKAENITQTHTPAKSFVKSKPTLISMYLEIFNGNTVTQTCKCHANQVSGVVNNVF